MAIRRERPRSRSSEAPRAGDDRCECRSGPIYGSALVNGATFTGRWLHYADVEGKAMFEGDIVLGDTSDAQSDESGNVVLFSVGISGQQFRWPDGRIPFEIDPALPNQQRVTQAIAHWEANTGIRFVARNAGNASQFNDFVRFVPGGGCSSMIGRRGGRQDITLGPDCTLGNAIHEIGHAVGLWHEQSREDRDDFVQIVFANVDPAMQHNFNQHVSDGDDLGPYDFGSVMHYPPNAFSINNQPTIVPRQPLPPGVAMGQRNGLSPGDIAGVRAMYPGLGTTVKEITKEPLNEPTIKEIRKEPTFEPTIKEVPKDPGLEPTVKEVGKDPGLEPTLKEIPKDPGLEPTIKEVRKDPVVDPTVKEIRKDPIRDASPTIKEVSFDPGPVPGPGPGPFPPPFRPGQPIMEPGATPFVLAGASRYAPVDPLVAAAEQVQQLAQAHTQAQQAADALAQAYEAAVRELAALQQGGMA